MKSPGVLEDDYIKDCGCAGETALGALQVSKPEMRVLRAQC